MRNTNHCRGIGSVVFCFSRCVISCFVISCHFVVLLFGVIWCPWGPFVSGMLFGVIFRDLNTGLFFSRDVIFYNLGVIFLELFLRRKILPTTNRNWIIFHCDMTPPRNNIPYENCRFSEKMLFLSCAFEKIPPWNMAGGEFGHAAFFLIPFTLYCKNLHYLISLLAWWKIYIYPIKFHRVYWWSTLAMWGSLWNFLRYQT